MTLPDSNVAITSVIKSKNTVACSHAFHGLLKKHFQKRKLLRLQIITAALLSSCRSSPARSWLPLWFSEFGGGTCVPYYFTIYCGAMWRHRQEQQNKPEINLKKWKSDKPLLKLENWETARTLRGSKKAPVNSRFFSRLLRVFIKCFQDSIFEAPQHLKNTFY